MPAVQVDRTEVKSGDAPDETRTPPNSLIEQFTVGGHTMGRIRMKPGWSWSENIKPIAGTERCEFSHVGYALSGSLTIETAEGEEQTIRPGDFYSIAPGHHAWNRGDEDYVALEVISHSAEAYARRS